MRRREFLRRTGGLVLATLLKTKRPNILFIMSDDHASTALSCYAGLLNSHLKGVIQTPNLDRLAREGTLFRNAFVTNALCAPSRATILTGKYAHLHGVRDNTMRFDGSQTTFPKLLQRAGYRTALVGKWHLQSDPEGFDYWCILPGQGLYNDPVFIEHGKRIKRQGYVTEIITELCIDWLKQWHAGFRSQPFCLLCHHKAPHRPWAPATRHHSLFADIEIPVPPTFDDDYRHRASAAAHADMRIADMPDYAKEIPPNLSLEERKRWNYQRFIKDYMRCVVAVDESVGALVDYLERLGVLNETLVIYTSDNGFFLGEHGWYDKRFMDEPSIRVPMLVRYPLEVLANEVNESIVLNVDIAPTLLDFAGVAIPSNMQGHSLRPLLQGKRPQDWRTAFYYRYYEYPGPHRVLPHYGIRTERYKLVHYPTTGEWELFDLQVDPNETRNRYGEPKYAKVVEELQSLLGRLKAEMGDKE
ncbi:MAG: sulfatase family protein [Candidatus Fervidibacter sp.]|uniref:sulfatase family protein n=1 Tax=Candidatus Fervidibacter sp. TaxID=3100871 RepID=UPI004049963F